MIVDAQLALIQAPVPVMRVSQMVKRSGNETRRLIARR